jgi:peptidyl-tRNA hydrolase
MRRVFVIRKDLHLKPGKLAAMIGHCCEAYWTNLLKSYAKSGNLKDNEFETLPAKQNYSDGRTGPAIYKYEKLMKLSQEAFYSGKDTFTTLRENPEKTIDITITLPKDIWNDYVNSIFTKTICECRNKNQLSKAETIAKEIGLIEGLDYGYINDKCLTDLTPENEDGTCTVGIWFKPLEDEIAHKISKKFPLYRDE